MSTLYVSRVTQGETVYVERDACGEVTLLLRWEHETTDGVIPASTTILSVEVEQIVFLSVREGSPNRRWNREDMSENLARKLGELLREQMGEERLQEAIAEDRR